MHGSHSSLLECDTVIDFHGAFILKGQPVQEELFWTA